MAWLPPFLLVFIIRFLAGVASAGMLIFGSTLIMQHTRHPFVLAALFSGVGVGIALGNEYVLAGLHFALSSQTLWQGAGALSAIILLVLALLIPSKKHIIAPAPLAKIAQQPMSWWLLAILYGLAGFGYIIRRHLPAAHGERRGPACADGSPLDTGRLVDCPRLLWLAVGSQTVGSITLPDREFAGAGDLRAVNPRQQLSFITHHQQYWFWRHLYGDDLAGDDHRPPACVPGNLNLLGFVTLIYGIGQILGPALTSMLGNGTSALASATLCGAAALFIAALICGMQIFKLHTNDS